MPQAIVTKYLGPTNHLGARVKVSCQAKTLTLSWNYDEDTNENHDMAVKKLVKTLGWDKWLGRWIGADMPNSEKSHRCYVFFGRVR